MSHGMGMRMLVYIIYIVKHSVTVSVDVVKCSYPTRLGDRFPFDKDSEYCISLVSCYTIYPIYLYSLFMSTVCFFIIMFNVLLL